MSRRAPAPVEPGDVHGGTVFSVSGPVVVAENMVGCAMYELVSCPRRLLCPCPAKQLPVPRRQRQPRR